MSPHPKDSKESPTTRENKGDAINDAAATSTEESCTACHGGEGEDSVMPRGSSIPSSMVHENEGPSVLIVSSGDSPGPTSLPGQMPMKDLSQQSGVQRTCSQADEGYGTGKLASTIFSAEVRSNVETNGATGKQEEVAEEEEDEDDKGMCEGESTNEKKHTHDSGPEPDLKVDRLSHQARTQSGELPSSLIESSPSTVPRQFPSHLHNYTRSRPQTSSLPPSVPSNKVYDSYCVLKDPFPASIESSDYDSAKSELVVAKLDTLIQHHSVCDCESSYVANLPGKVVTGVTLPIVHCVGGEVCDPLVCAGVQDCDSLYAGPDCKLFSTLC